MIFQLTAPAKINLTLDVVGFDERKGFHQVDTVIYKLSDLADQLTLERADEFELTFSGYEIPTGRDNLIWKALDLLGDTKWNIHVTKNIPTESGLGGGSSDAASVLKAVGDLHELTVDLLDPLAKRLGCDVPMFLADGNYVYCTGRGDEVVESWRGPDLKVDLLDSGIRVSTREAYDTLDLAACGLEWKRTEMLVADLREGRFDKIMHNVHNDFETSFFLRRPDAVGRGHLCGSGGWMWRCSGVENERYLSQNGR